MEFKLAQSLQSRNALPLRNSQANKTFDCSQQTKLGATTDENDDYNDDGNAFESSSNDCCVEDQSDSNEQLTEVQGMTKTISSTRQAEKAKN